MGTNVSVSSAGGALAISDLSGDFYGQTGGGGITIEGATGRATLSTGGGAVTVLNSTLSGSVTTGGGEVTISNVTGGLRGSSGSGSRRQVEALARATSRDPTEPVRHRLTARRSLVALAVADAGRTSRQRQRAVRVRR